MPRSAMLRVALATSALLLVSACALPAGRGDPGFRATLSATTQVPPVTSPGTGQLEARFDKDKQVLHWKLTYSGLSGPVTAAHFHGPALAGHNAGVALPLQAPFTSPLRGEASLTPLQTADLMAGRWYINLHTAAHPAGEIRGQLNPVP